MRIARDSCALVATIGKQQNAWDILGPTQQVPALADAVCLAAQQRWLLAVWMLAEPRTRSTASGTRPSSHLLAGETGRVPG